MHMSAEIIQFSTARPFLRTKKGIDKDAWREKIYASISDNALGCVIDGKVYEVTFYNGKPTNACAVYASTRAGSVRICRRHLSRDRHDAYWYLREAESIIRPAQPENLLRGMQQWKDQLTERLAAIDRAIAELDQQKPSPN